MEKLKPEDVRRALLDLLGDESVVEVSRDHPEGRITGWVMSPSFNRVSRVDRQSWLAEGNSQGAALPRWNGLCGAFRDRATQIGLILTFSPAEYENAFGEGAKTA